MPYRDPSPPRPPFSLPLSLSIIISCLVHALYSRPDVMYMMALPAPQRAFSHPGNCNPCQCPWCSTGDTGPPIDQVHTLDPADPTCRGMRSAFKIVLDGGKTIVLNTLDPADRQKWVENIDLAASDSFKVVDDDSRKQLENRLETERLMRDRGRAHDPPQQNT